MIGEGEVSAHEQKTTLHVIEFFPAHEPRESDPHYHAFLAVRARLKALGKLRCWVCGAMEHVELHHNVVEFALANGVDLAKFADKFPEFKMAWADRESFLAWVESEGNLLPLCKLHHTGAQGIHVLPYPAWRALAIWRDGLEPPGQVENSDEWLAGKIKSGG